MTPISYIAGDATAKNGATKNKRVVLAHVVNDVGAWGMGFVLAISKRWPHASKEYKAWVSLHSNPLGHVLIGDGDETTDIAHLCAQHKYGIKKNGVPPIRYEALETCLSTLAKEFIDSGNWECVHMPRIGCGLAGGKWPQVEEIINRTLCANDIKVKVFDLK